MPEGRTSNSRILLIGGLALLAVVVGAVIWLMNHPIGGKPPSDPVAVKIATAMKVLDELCLSGTSAEEKADVHAKMEAALKAPGADAGATHSQQVLNGVAENLSQDGQLKDREAIRACMQQNLPTILGAFSVVTPASTEHYPQPLETRLMAKFTLPSGQLADNHMIIALRGANWVNEPDDQVPQPAGYYHVAVGYPSPNEKVEGSIGPRMFDEVHAANSVAKICFRRPPVYAFQQNNYVLLDCEVGKVCGLNQMSPKWVDICDPSQQTAQAAPRRSTWVSFNPLATPAYAQTQPAPGWSVPSLRTWKERAPKLQGVGYTEFTVSTAAFQGQPVYGVEIGLKVNGEPIREDGLSPAQRPQPYDGKAPFTYGFGLRSLDMRGRDGGCDRLELTLRPLIRDKGAGAPLTVVREYAALRPLPHADLRAGSATVGWWGVYRTPPGKAYETEVFIASNEFDPANPASRAGALARIERLRAAFDAAGVTYGDRPLVGVIRPPLTKPSFGLAVATRGTPEAPGQLRFTFPVSTARALKTAMDASPRVRELTGAGGAFMYSAASNPERARAATPEGGCPSPA